MPVLETSSANRLFRHPHLSTIYPNLFRSKHGPDQERVRWETPDGDFIDVDLVLQQSDTLLILAHGLEGNSGRAYMQGMVRLGHAAGWDVASLNFRGCSGEPNRLYSSYHSGHTTDLRYCQQELLETYGHKNQVLVGFSLGGNVVLKYAGEEGAKIHPAIKAIGAVSVPCDLAGSAMILHRKENAMYLIRFLRSLKKKIGHKVDQFPESPITHKDLKAVKDFYDFDNLYTAPAHGFKDANDYYEQCSTLQFIPEIRVPGLLINALNDPFLSPTCFPFQQAKASKYVHLETPKYGGHVGFVHSLSMRGAFWHELRMMKFLQEQLNQPS